MIRISSILNLVCGYTSYCNIFFCKTFIYHSTSTYCNMICNFNFSENFYSWTYIHIISYRWSTSFFIFCPIFTP